MEWVVHVLFGGASMTSPNMCLKQEDVNMKKKGLGRKIATTALSLALLVSMIAVPSAAGTYPYPAPATKADAQVNLNQATGVYNVVKPEYDAAVASYNKAKAALDGQIAAYRDAVLAEMAARLQAVADTIKAANDAAALEAEARDDQAALIARKNEAEDRLAQLNTIKDERNALTLASINAKQAEIAAIEAQIAELEAQKTNADSPELEAARARLVEAEEEYNWALQDYNVSKPMRDAKAEFERREAELGEDYTAAKTRYEEAYARYNELSDKLNNELSDERYFAENALIEAENAYNIAKMQAIAESQGLDYATAKEACDNALALANEKDDLYWNLESEAEGSPEAEAYYEAIADTQQAWADYFALCDAHQEERDALCQAEDALYYAEEAYNSTDPESEEYADLLAELQRCQAVYNDCKEIYDPLEAEELAAQAAYEKAEANEEACKTAFHEASNLTEIAQAREDAWNEYWAAQEALDEITSQINEEEFDGEFPQEVLVLQAEYEAAQATYSDKQTAYEAAESERDAAEAEYLEAYEEMYALYNLDMKVLAILTKDYDGSTLDGLPPYSSYVKRISEAKEALAALEESLEDEASYLAAKDEFINQIKQYQEYADELSLLMSDYWTAQNKLAVAYFGITEDEEMSAWDKLYKAEEAVDNAVNNNNDAATRHKLMLLQNGSAVFRHDCEYCEGGGDTNYYRLWNQQDLTDIENELEANVASALAEYEEADPEWDEYEYYRLQHLYERALFSQNEFDLYKSIRESIEEEAFSTFVQAEIAYTEANNDYSDLMDDVWNLDVSEIEEETLSEEQLPYLTAYRNAIDAYVEAANNYYPGSCEFNGYSFVYNDLVPSSAWTMAGTFGFNETHPEQASLIIATMMDEDEQSSFPEHRLALASDALTAAQDAVTQLAASVLTEEQLAEIDGEIAARNEDKISKEAEKAAIEAEAQEDINAIDADISAKNDEIFGLGTAIEERASVIAVRAADAASKEEAKILAKAEYDNPTGVEQDFSVMNGLLVAEAKAKAELDSITPVYNDAVANLNKAKADLDQKIKEERTVGKVTGLKVVAGKKKATVSYSKGKNVTGYVIYRSTKKSSGFKKVATTKYTSWTNKSLKKGKTYYFKVKAYRVVEGKTYYSSSWSSTVKVKVK